MKSKPTDSPQETFSRSIRKWQNDTIAWINQLLINDLQEKKEEMALKIIDNNANFAIIIANVHLIKAEEDDINAFMNIGNENE